MKKHLLSLALVATVAATAASAQSIGQRPPEIKAVKWYNTPPLALEQLQGKAILVEVFRTW